jgi:DNA-binding transcriptional MerR regulator
VDNEQGRFNIDELAELGRVSRRTVRYYVQEGLLPAPLGVGRGRHYDQSHLERLLEVKAHQEVGLSLDEIHARLTSSPRPAPSAPPAPRAARRGTWTRLELAPGVELHVAHDIHLPDARRLNELVAWCRHHLSRHADYED